MMSLEHYMTNGALAGRSGRRRPRRRRQLTSSVIAAVAFEPDGTIAARLTDDFGYGAAVRLTPRPVMGGTSFEWRCLANLAPAILRTMSCEAQPWRRSALHAHDLAQLVHDLDEVALRVHHRVDRLVGGGRLVDHVGVLAALDAARSRAGGPRAVKRRRASPRDIARPAPWLQLSKLSGLPLPRTMNERAPMLPGMMPRSPARARTAPLRVTSTSGAEVVLARDVVVVAVDRAVPRAGRAGRAARAPRAPPPASARG